MPTKRNVAKPLKKNNVNNSKQRKATENNLKLCETKQKHAQHNQPDTKPEQPETMYNHREYINTNFNKLNNLTTETTSNDPKQNEQAERSQGYLQQLNASWSTLQLFKTNWKSLKQPKTIKTIPTKLNKHEHSKATLKTKQTETN